MARAHPAGGPGGPDGPGGPGGPGRGDLPVRILSAVALAPLALAAAYLGGWVFALFWLIAALGVLWEWNGLVAGAAAAPRVTLGGAVALAAAVVALADRRLELAILIVAAGAAVGGLLGPAGQRAWSAAGVPYAACIVIPAVVLRADAAHGFAAIVLLFAVVWGTDIAAYFGGRLIGGPKLWPRVTPSKTWSGALVGAAVAVAAGVGVAWATGLGGLAGVASVCLVLSIASQAGDLFESAVKRRFGAKDAGKLIPGHGGLMDRLDGFAVASLAAAIIGGLRGGFEAPARGLLIW